MSADPAQNSARMGYLYLAAELVFWAPAEKIERGSVKPLESPDVSSYGTACLLSSPQADGEGGTSGKRQHEASALGRAVVMSALTKDHVHRCTQGLRAKRGA